VDDEPTVIETTDPSGARVVLPRRVWDEKIIRDHPEIDTHMPDVSCGRSPNPITRLPIPAMGIAPGTTLRMSDRAAGCWSS